MRTTMILAATAVLLTAGPAFASNKTPQTFFSGPGSEGSVQQQDMQRSQMLSQQNDARNAAAAKNMAQQDSMHSQSAQQ